MTINSIWNSEGNIMTIPTQQVPTNVVVVPSVSARGKGTIWDSTGRTLAYDNGQVIRNYNPNIARASTYVSNPALDLPNTHPEYTPGQDVSSDYRINPRQTYTNQQAYKNYVDAVNSAENERMRAYLSNYTSNTRPSINSYDEYQRLRNGYR